MTILLTILKVIGIVLLVLAGLVLAAVLMVLLVPIRYRAEGAYQDEFQARGRITWLFHLLSVSFSYEGAFLYSVRIAGIRILPRSEEKRKKSPKSHTDTQTASDAAADVPESATAEAAKTDAAKTDAIKTDAAKADAAKIDAVKTDAAKAAETEPATANPLPAGPATARENAGTEQETAKTPEKDMEPENAANTAQPDAAAEPTEKQRFDHPGLLLEKVYAFFRKCQEKYKATCAKIKKVQADVSYYVGILKREETKRLLSLTLSQLRRIFRHLLPRKMKVQLCVGTGDPASTGQILALAGMLYPIFGERICVVPDFDEKHVEATFYMKGRITLLVLLLCVLRVVVNQNFRKLIRILRKKEEV